MNSSNTSSSNIFNGRPASPRPQVRPPVSRPQPAVHAARPAQAQVAPRPTVAHAAASPTLKRPVAEAAPAQAHAKSKGSKGSSKGNKKVFIIAASVVAVGALAVLGVMFIPKLFNKQETETNENIGVISPSGQPLTEEDKRITEKTISEAADVSIKGYKEIEAENGKRGVVTISVRNTSSESTSYAIEVAVNNSDGELLEILSFYAEGIEPGQTVEADMYPQTTSAEDLKNAKFEIFRAYTYTPEWEDSPAVSTASAETITATSTDDNSSQNYSEQEELENQISESTSTTDTDHLDTSVYEPSPESE
ncbi:hypothetical protein IKG20_00390 [Candidatus Saccharibacteria bacterium]|nr:hypothetical protein [Candidatus Saccharibacteria bacterium]